MNDFTTSDEYVEGFKKRVEAFHKTRPFLTKLAARIIIHYYQMTDIESTARFDPYILRRELDSWVMDMESYALVMQAGRMLVPTYWLTIFQVAAFVSSHAGGSDRRIKPEEIMEALRMVDLFIKKDKLKSFIEGSL